MFSNFIPNKINKIDDRDPPWMSEFFTKLKIHWHNSIYKKFQNSSRNAAEYNILQQAIAEVSELIYLIRSKIINTMFETVRLCN